MPLIKLKDKFVKEKYSVGLDIGTSAIKIVKLKLAKDKVECCGYHLEPAQIDLEQVIKSCAKTQDALRVNISFSGAGTIIRYASFLKMTTGELKQALKFEAQKHIPFSVNEVFLDGYTVKNDMPDNKMLVLLAAVKKDLINHRLKLLEGAGLKVSIADIDSLALVNAFNFNRSPEEAAKHKVIALLNIGAAQSNLNILEEGVPLFSRDIPIGGNACTQKIADALNIDPKAADQLKIKSDKTKSAQIDAAVEPVLANLANEIRVSCDYFESRSAASVGKLYLSGGASQLTGLKEHLDGLLALGVEFWSPFGKIKPLPGVDVSKLEEFSKQFAISVGLALRG